jgi:large subunit ribosomal protein L14
MIQQQTILNVSDNSGAKKVKCIKILGGFKKRTSSIGEIIIVSIIELRNKSRKTSKVKKGEIYRALIIKTKKQVKNKDGSTYFFNQNSVSLVNKLNKPLASRIIGSIPKKLKKSKYSKFTNIAQGIV